MDELNLWENIKRGDVKSLNRLHSHYFSQMCLFAKKTVHDNQLVENIVSDCFIKLWENRKKIEIKTSQKSYLYQVLRNQIIDHYRGKQEKAELLEELPDILMRLLLTNNSVTQNSTKPVRNYRSNEKIFWN